MPATGGWVLSNGCAVRIFNFNWVIVCGCNELDFIGQGTISNSHLLPLEAVEFPVDCNMVQIIDCRLLVYKLSA